MRISVEDVDFKKYDNFTLVNNDRNNKRIIEFKKGKEPSVYQEGLKKIFDKDNGILLPPYLREQFGNRRIVPLNDPKILEVFLEVIYPNFSYFDNYSWETGEITQKKEGITVRFD